MRNRLKILLNMLILGVGGISVSAFSLNLPNTPVFLNNQSSPNVMFLLDDSGSMDWSIMSKKHWDACAYDPQLYGGFSSSNCGSYRTNGLIKIRERSYSSYRDTKTYLYQNSDNIYGNCSGSYSWSQQCSSRKDWRIYSSDFNVLAYNPINNYQVWQAPCSGTTGSCNNANFNAVRSNPRVGETGYNVIRDLNNHHYEVWIDDKGFSGTRPKRGSYNNNTTTANQLVDLWDTHYQIKFTATGAILNRIDYTPDDNGINKNISLIATLNNPNLCYNALGNIGLIQQIHNGIITPDSSSLTGCRTIDNAKQNFANWYQYHRKRSFVAKHAIGQVINTAPFYRYGLTVINQYDALFSEVNSINNNALLASLYAYNWPARGTPLRRGLEKVGQYYAGQLSGKTNPVIHACQKNFAVVITDGYWNGSHPSSLIGDSDQDGIYKTLADVANYYNKNDFNSLSGEQYVSTFTVAFGVNGNLTDTDSDGWPNPALAANNYWGNPFNQSSAKIDDLWHAAFNAGGVFVSANTPESVTEKLSTAISNIQVTQASQAEVAQNSRILTTDSKIYYASFNSIDWTGNLQAKTITENGIGSDVWSASIPTNRQIISYSHESKQGIAFKTPLDLQNPTTDELSLEQVTLLTAQGQNLTQLIAYLRGDSSNEIKNGGVFRNRNSLLGDIIHSSPIYVDAPKRFYPDNLESDAYASFKNHYKERDKLIYVGANDGMLHAFNADTGSEVFAYIPGHRTIYQNLSSLSNSGYSHKYFVDGALTEGDVYINGTWRTILAGSMQKGAQGIFVLDITDPANLLESNAKDIALFEFNDTADATLGYVYSKPKIAKLANNKWAVIFTSGYNNTENDGFVASSNSAVLYILFIEDGLDGSWQAGSDFIKLEVPESALTDFNLADTNSDFIVDYIYAGSLSGNLYRFNLTDTSPQNWNSQLLVNVGAPITTAPIVARHPNNGHLIYFGTGKYLETIDNNVGNNKFYALWDKLDNNQINLNQLLQQQVLGTVSNMRISSNNSIDWNTHTGWQLDLPNEAIITKAILRHGRVIFNTVIVNEDGCTLTASGWLMELDRLNGGRMATAVFDNNSDGVINSDDLLDASQLETDATSVASSGTKLDNGISTRAHILLKADRSIEIKVLSGSTGLQTVKESTGNNILGRQSWRNQP